MANGKLKSKAIVVYALGLLGGGKKKIHLEDIAFKCYQISPNRFQWSRFQYPDKSLTRHSLNGNMRYGLVETNKSHWSLTAEGVKWLAENKSIIDKMLGTGEVKGGFDMTKQERKKFVKHIEDQDIFGAWSDLEVGLENTTQFQLADLLDCLPETPSDNKLSKLHIMKSKAVLIQREDIQRFLGECEDHFFGE